MSFKWLALGVAIMGCQAWPQSPEKLDPETVPPQVVVNVRKHPVGADMVTITISEKDYPLELLRTQAQRMATLLGSDARGLSLAVTGSDPKVKFLKAAFATDGIIDHDKGTVRLGEIVRAFLGAPAPHTIRSFLITLEGEAPVDKQTLKSYESPEVVLSMHASEVPKGLEYRVVALSQDPDKVSIPVRWEEPVPAEKPKPRTVRESNPGLTFALIGVAGAAGGALVYLALSGRSSRKAARPGLRK